ncbi:MAG: septal ring lytic transglycosylase RlpA family protein [Nitrospirae bacterium]|nr:septal ring lytic transglycosylase RlpA family protein [Nitrospirota bacterium]
MIAVLLSSCSGRYAVAPEKPSYAPVQKPSEKQPEKEQRTYEFKEFKGDQRYVVASWYGPDFHGRPTSSGELFNMHAFTCAHKEYPFGTKLKVVNTKNSKEVECTVNDRGPFVAGRDLDLSYAAAKKIDLVGPGTSTVMIEPVGRDLRYAKYVKYGVLDAVLTIQIGAFRDEANAKRLKMALELRYSNVYIMEADVGNSRYYRVRMGKFTTKNEAVTLGKSLADEGYNVLITKFEQQI